MEKIRKGDDVIVTAGKDKGKRGTVLRIVDARHLVVEGVNRVKKHQRPNPMKNQTGGIVDKDMPIDISNVALFNPQTKKADWVGFKMMQDGRKVREEASVVYLRKYVKGVLHWLGTEPSFTNEDDRLEAHRSAEEALRFYEGL